jgi:hypothetical protein
MNRVVSVWSYELGQELTEDGKVQRHLEKVIEIGKYL